MAGRSRIPAPPKTPEGVSRPTRPRSLRNVKDSTEDLHRRRAGRTSASPGRANASNFTVSNIGNNGLIYLRPVSRGDLHPPVLSTPSPPVPHNQEVGGVLPAEDGNGWRDTMLTPSDASFPSPLLDRNMHAGGISARGSVAPRGPTTLAHSSEPAQHGLGIGEAVPVESSTQNGLNWVEIPHSDNAAADEEPFRDDMSSSTISKQDYYNVFPAPPITVQNIPGPLGVASETADQNAYERELFEASMSETSSSILRMSSATGDIVAASISRLINQITSPDLLDYVMLSDFFLTFRSFLSPDDLLTRLFARMRWAVNRPDSFGRKVRVRTFVALRHWVLNYFVEDFVTDPPLRGRFCELANALCQELRARADGGGGDLKILGELKKCWRSTCALYWDIPCPRGGDSVDELILPGGEIGSRDVGTDQEFSSANREGPKAAPEPANEKVQTSGQRSNSGNATHKASKSTYDNINPGPADIDPVLLTRSSRDSTQLYSCSIPKTFLQRGVPNDDRALGPQPRKQAKDTPTTSAMPLRPLHSHKGSFSDALRSDGPSDSLTKKETDAKIAAVARQIPGSLIRGITYQPQARDVEVYEPTSPVEHEFSADAKSTSPTEGPRGDGLSPGSANPAVRKLFGSVRRAFIANRPIEQKALNGLERARSVNQSSAAKSAATTTTQMAKPGTQTKSGARPSGERRIDFLTSEAYGSFLRVVRERNRDQDEQGRATDGLQRPHSQRSSRSAPDRLASSSDLDTGRLNSHVTAGSRSIVIVDDTRPAGTKTSQKPKPKPKQSAIPAPKQTAARSLKTPSKSAIRTPSKSGSTKSAEQLRRRPETPKSSYSKGSTSSIPKPRPARRAEDIKIPPRAYHSMMPLPKSTLTPTLPSSKTMTPVKTVVSKIPMAPGSSGHKLSSGSANAASTDKAPARQLRRKPGGDLRAADDIHDAVKPSVPKAKSGKAPASSLRPVVADTTAATKPTAGGQIEEKPGSVVSTHSSQPKLRPSFEAEVAKLAQLPDDEDDDGGVESTLLKLEGRYSKSPSTPTTSDPPYRSSEDMPMKIPFNTDPDEQLHTSTKEPQQNIRPASSSATKRSIPRPQLGSSLPSRAPRTKSPSPSEHSYSSVPLLERGQSTSTVSRRRKSPSEWIQVLIPPRQSSAGLNTRDSGIGRKPGPNSSDGSLVIVEKTNSIQNIPPGGTQPTTLNTNQSFLMDDTNSIGSFSIESGTSNMDRETDNNSIGMRSFYNDSSLVISDEPFLEHPLRHPETPPIVQGLVHSTQGDQRRNVMFSRASTPSAAPLNLGSRSGKRKPAIKSKSASELRMSEDVAVLPNVSQPKHLPFVMAYDSLQIAQQLTLIERDAFAEIEWRDLIELRWSQIVPPVQNWVQYLTFQNRGKSSAPPMHGGVDLVVTRFNLMFKWALSEVVLTEDIYERAACITKYIRIAVHCRTLHNWATLCQITMALVSGDCSRLTHTWNLISHADKRALSELEALITPMRNFANLRAEIDKAPAIATDGCIPFLGIYTHDLIYNAQKPAYIETQSSDDPLINFERHHTAAAIVKNLLSLIEASSRYSFKPCPELISRCLWISSLNDDEIAKKSRALEP